MFGSVVMEFLSLKASGSVSSIRKIGSPQCSPPSLLRLTSSALRPLIGGVGLLLKGSEKKYAVPSSPNAVQGSVERWNGPPVHLEISRGTLVFQVAPPSTLTPARRPLEPPLLHRSCCTPVNRWPAVVGSTAIHGSIAEAGKLVPGWLLTWSAVQSLKIVPPDIFVSGPSDCAHVEPAVSVTAPTSVVTRVLHNAMFFDPRFCCSEPFSRQSWNGTSRSVPVRGRAAQELTRDRIRSPHMAPTEHHIRF